MVLFGLQGLPDNDRIIYMIKRLSQVEGELICGGSGRKG